MADKNIEKPKKASPGTPEDPTDHSKSASALAAQVDPAGKSGATVNAKSMEAVKDKAKDEQPADNSLAGKILKSQLFVVNDHVNGGGPYVGISPQSDPNASESSKRLSSVNPLGIVAPRTGMQVRPKDGDAFAIGEGFGPDSTPAEWAKVTKPDGSLLFA
jgi:hypothetical protein